MLSLIKYIFIDYNLPKIMKEMIRPYRQTHSARPTKISDLPRMEPSSLMAPRAAEAAADTAIPPPMQARPVESAAAKYPMPATPEAAAAGSAAAALPENMKTAETIRVPKNKNALTNRAKSSSNAD